MIAQNFSRNVGGKKLEWLSEKILSWKIGVKSYSQKMDKKNLSSCDKISNWMICQKKVN